MSFGLANSEASFCRLMRIILSNLPNVDSFADDMWIFTETWKDHMTSLRQVLDRLRSAKLTVKPSKCMIGYDTIECLGHNIIGQTVRPQEDKTQASRDAPRPSTKRQIKSFLGFQLAGFYRRFIPNFSSIASPLTDLTKKNNPNSIKDWQDHHIRAFQTLKNRLTSSPILRLPVYQEGKLFVPRTDASDIGLGAVLLQDFEGEGHLPIAYASKKLLPRNYSVIEKESLGIIWGVEKFRKYLYGVEFLLQTDHKPLSYMQTAKVFNPRIMRRAMKLQLCKFKIVAIRGRDN